MKQCRMSNVLCSNKCFCNTFLVSHSKPQLGILHTNIIQLTQFKCNCIIFLHTLQFTVNFQLQQYLFQKRGSNISETDEFSCAYSVVSKMRIEFCRQEMGKNKIFFLQAIHECRHDPESHQQFQIFLRTLETDKEIENFHGSGNESRDWLYRRMEDCIPGGNKKEKTNNSVSNILFSATLTT